MRDEVTMTIGQAIDALAQQRGVTVMRHALWNTSIMLPNDYELSLYFGHPELADVFVEVAVFMPPDAEGWRDWLVPDHEVDEHGIKFDTYVMPYVNAHELVRLADRISRLHEAQAGPCWCVLCEYRMAKEVA